MTLRPIGTRRTVGNNPDPLPTMDVLVALYGHNTRRAVATANTFARWHQYQAEMPTVWVAWCYAEGHAPAALEQMPTYPWLRRVPLPQYDLSDGIFRKEGLLEYLLWHHSTAPYVLSLDSDAWSDNPTWFRQVADTLAQRPDNLLQPFRNMVDTKESMPLPSLASQTLSPDGKARHNSQPGLGWGFSRAWASAHGTETVFNPWLVTGSGDCAFVLEHLPQADYAGRYRDRHPYPYFRSVLRDGLPQGHLACVPVDVRHENHTDRSAVPAEFRQRRYADRAYHWSRRILDYWGDLRQYVYLDAKGVPMPVDPAGPWCRSIRRKPELQDRVTTETVIAEEMGISPRPAARFTPSSAFAAAASQWPDYYGPDREVYYAAARRMVAQFPGPALEVGPFRCPLMASATYLDVQDYGAAKPLLLHDLNTGRMPFADDSFAVAVALQVVEHTAEPWQTLAELVRVARVAVVSLPYEWPSGDPGHSDIDAATIAAWLRQANAKAIAREIVGTMPRRRIVLTIQKKATP